MTLPELTAAVSGLRQIEAQIASLRGVFLMGGAVAFARQANDIGIMVADLIQDIERQIAKQGQP